MTPRLHPLLLLGLSLYTGCFDTSVTSSKLDDEGSSDTGMATSTEGSSDGNDESDATTSGDPDTSGGPIEGSTGEPEESTTDGLPADPAPEVLFFEPVDGATQVYDPTVTIVFSEPVIQPSLEAAFPAGSDFRWSDDGTQVEFEVPLPFEGEPVVHELTVPASVTDLAGNALSEPYVSAFELASVTTTTIPYDPDASTCCDGMFDFLLAGDDNNDAVHHAGVSFPMAGLPPSALAVRTASLEMTVGNLAGDIEQAAFGRFVVDHVAFAHRAQIDAPTMLDAGFAVMFETGGAAEGPITEIDVTDQFVASREAGAESFQLRVHPEASNGNGVADAIIFNLTEEEQPRVEVEYFE